MTASEIDHMLALIKEISADIHALSNVCMNDKRRNVRMYAYCAAVGCVVLGMVMGMIIKMAIQ